MEPVKSSTANVEIVYPKPIEELDEFAPHSNSDLVKKLNEIIRKTNKNG